MPVMEQAPPYKTSGRPRLENGDRLHSGEFLRRYQAMEEDNKAELVQGVVYIASPVSLGRHGSPDMLIHSWIGAYVGLVDGVRCGSNSTVKLGPEDVPQPDTVLLKEDGQAKMDEGGYVIGAPELVVEIAASSVSLDAGFKRESYLRSGVKEYLLWRVDDGEIDWWRSDEAEGDWIAIEADEADEAELLQSTVFQGLVLNRKAALQQDFGAVLKTLHESVGKTA